MARRSLDKTPKSPPPPNPTPKPNYAASVPDREDFAAWCEHPVTRFVAEAMEAGAKAQEAEWMRLTWVDGAQDRNGVPVDTSRLLLELRTRSDAYRAFLETSWSDYVNFVQRT